MTLLDVLVMASAAEQIIEKINVSETKSTHEPKKTTTKPKTKEV